MKEKLEQLYKTISAEIQKASTVAELEEVKNTHMSRKSELNNMRKNLKELSVEDKKIIGALTNKISQDFNTIMGNSICIESFIQLSKRNPRFNEIIRTKLTPGMQPKDIEKLQHELTAEEIEILSKEPNCLRPMLHAGAGIKDKQLAEFSITGGLKPDVNGNTIPIPIDSNFLVGGLNNVTNYYVDSQAGRKSVILNKTWKIVSFTSNGNVKFS